MIRSFSQIVGAARNAAGGTVDAIVSPLAGMATDLDNKAFSFACVARDLCNTAKAYEADASRARGIAKNIRKAFQDLGHDIQGAN